MEKNITTKSQEVQVTLQDIHDPNDNLDSTECRIK